MDERELLRDALVQVDRGPERSRRFGTTSRPVRLRLSLSTSIRGCPRASSRRPSMIAIERDNVRLMRDSQGQRSTWPRAIRRDMAEEALSRT